MNVTIENSNISKMIQNSEYNETILEIHKELECNPDDECLLEQLVYCYYKIGAKEEAINTYEQLIKVGKINEIIQSNFITQKYEEVLSPSIFRIISEILISKNSTEGYVITKDSDSSDLKLIERISETIDILFYQLVSSLLLEKTNISEVIYEKILLLLKKINITFSDKFKDKIQKIDPEKTFLLFDFMLNYDLYQKNITIDNKRLNNYTLLDDYLSDNSETKNFEIYQNKLYIILAKVYFINRDQENENDVLNNIKNALSILLNICFHETNDESHLILLANIQFFLRLYSEALETYQKVTLLNANNALALAGIGRCLLQNNNNDSIKYFEKSLNIKINYLALLNISRINNSKEDFQKATDILQYSLEKQAVLSYEELLYIAEKSIDYQENHKQADYYIGYIINSDFEEIDYYSIVRIYEKIYKKVTDPTEKKNYKEKYTDTFKKAFEVEANIEKFAESHLEKIEQLIQLDLEQIKKEAEHRDTLEREVEKEKSRVFQQLAHTLKNITSSVKDSLNILFEEEALKDYQDEIAPAIRGVNLITDYITSINQSFHIVPEDMQYDVINSVDGSKYIVIQDILLESIQYAISNMFDYKYFGKYQKKFFPTKNDSITARKEWEKIYKNLNWENLSLFLKEHFFNFALLDYSKSCLKIGNIKDSKNKLLTLFQEIFLNAFKYSSPVEKEKRVVAITIEESEDCIQLSIENTFNLTSSYKNTGVGLLIIKNYQPIYKKPPSIEREENKYRITIYITNYWKEVKS